MTLRRKSVVLLLSGAAVFVALALMVALSDTAAIPAALKQPVRADVEYLDRNGKSLRRAPVEAGRFREPLANAPEMLAAATIAAEDKRFYAHGGVDFLATARALATGRGGGSTITQQLIKIGSAPRSRTLSEKAREMLAARELERRWSKDRVLAEYLSRIDYGNRQIGAARAADFYFGKTPDELSAAEAAFLAALPNAPTRLNPHGTAAPAQTRQQLILDRMERSGLLTKDTADRARVEPLRLLPPSRNWHAPHLVDLIHARSDGATGTVWTTIDLHLQNTTEHILATRLSELSTQNVRHGAVVVIENSTGAVLALCGSPDYSGESGHVNGALATRSAGSALKPLIYAMAFELGDSDTTLVDDVPAEFTTASGLYRPVNYNRKHYGPVTYRNALGNSLNISAVKVLERVGGAAAFRERLRACGIRTLTQPADHYGPGLAIGNGGVRLLELTNAFAMLARGGNFLECHWIAGEPDTPTIRRFDETACRLVTDILCDNDARVDTFGWFSPLRLPFPTAVKTGTSSDYRDNWCVGYTPEFTVGVWVGNFDGSAMQNVSGVTGAGPIFHDLMVHLAKEFGVTDFPNTTSATNQQSTCNQLQIDWPKNGARLFLDPDLPGGGSVLTPRAANHNAVEWSSPTLKITHTPRTEVNLTPGSHQLTVRTPDGTAATVQIEVEEL